MKEAPLRLELEIEILRITQGKVVELLSCSPVGYVFKNWGLLWHLSWFLFFRKNGLPPFRWVNHCVDLYASSILFLGFMLVSSLFPVFPTIKTNNKFRQQDSTWQKTVRNMNVENTPVNFQVYLREVYIHFSNHEVSKTIWNKIFLLHGHAKLKRLWMCC